ncbi:GntR family transcriptional regulator [Corynebacterium aquilae]|uniref:HTH gntR-type domain-containing protein n=1 Tax=Corynebacterium aquilae DSM 44791 TaxID=1431546 RepID=A0A1L7CHT7_9CORY|nr:GntR family transcriptional regulator [Corynebacterium aquilae]APT85426.1 hypothetical protein CAQU_10625 [Corynebacterium aquilae DSM 44791]
MPHPSVKRIKPRLSLRETVAEQLRTAIISGELVEGELYSAPALGEAFGVSATPVREAMMDLSREGLIETLKNKGFRVTGMTDAELEHNTEIRLLLEPYAARKAAEAVAHRDPKPGEFDAMKALAAEIVEAARKEDLITYLKADRQFHEELLKPCGNEQLIELITGLRCKTRQYGLKTLAKDKRLVHNAEEHLQMVDLLERGQPQELEDLIRRHLSHARGMWNAG